MSKTQSINTGGNANDGTGDPLRTAFNKINSNFSAIKSDLCTAPRVVLVGDSITAIHTALGSNKNTYHDPRGYFVWLQVRLGFPFSFTVGNNGSQGLIGQNAGIIGDTTTGILARLDSDVIAKNPDIVFVHAGTNDITGGASFATITGNLNAIYTTLLNQGILVTVMPLLPRSGAQNWGTTAARQLHHAVSNWIREKALTTQGMILIDGSAAMTDPASSTGDARTNYTVDGLHPSPIGGFYIGDAAYKVFKTITRPAATVCYSPSDTYDATNNPAGNLLTNGQLAGTGGTVGTGATGQAADNWSLSRTAGTAVTAAGSKVSRTDGLPGSLQQIVVSCNGSGSTDGTVTFTTTPSSITSNIATNNWYEALLEIDVSATTNSASMIEGIYLELWDTTATVGSRVRCLNNYTGFKFPDAAWSGILKTPPLQLAGTTGLRYKLLVDVDETKNDSVTIKIGRCTVRQMVTPPTF
ncbi:MAG: GDSL-type esterase/lipase family protein [Rickettsiales bacterium]